MKKGVDLQIRGVVQGVGFRPFIYRLACRYDYSGFVVNTGSGVKICIDKIDERFKEFLDDVSRYSPPMARIDALDRKEIVPGNRERFSILASRSSEISSFTIPPDIATCSDCYSELFNPADSRYLYPFINCTNCGPRFSIMEGLPYDRDLTSMCCFSMCPECEAEYRDPASRRFHAQPNSCRRCGPALSWHRSDFSLVDCLNPLAEAARALSRGRVVAIRGIGGFHLAADAGSEEAVQKVRRIKGRKSKPLAVMLADLEAVKRHCRLSLEEEFLLTSFRRPIVLLRQRDDYGLAPGLAPGLDETGVMLPYTPVHHILFARPEIPRALVMTSANISGEPICADNRQARNRLSGLADFFLSHDRQIIHPLDDSVTRIVSGRTRLIRRSRGYVPEPFSLEHDFPDILACGGQSKNTFCFIKKDKAFLSQHIGTLSNSEVFKYYQESIRFFGRILGVAPEAVACDLHPDYLSSRHARSCALPMFEVQHHHAHAAAVMAEHALSEKCLAVIMDGAGLGPDNTIWGGEIMLVDYAGYRRLARLQTLPMPGGDLAARELYRMGFAAWWTSCNSDKNSGLPVSLQRLPAKTGDILRQMISRDVNTPYTSSCGRLFDAVASLLDFRHKSDYEGQSGMELETLARRALEENALSCSALTGSGLLPVSVDSSRIPAVIVSVPMIRELLFLLESGYEISRLALEFHIWLISSIAATICQVIDNSDHRPVILGGGCLQNALFLKGLEESLETRGLTVYSPGNLPANDGCIALGQAVIAGTLLKGLRSEAHKL